MCLIRILDLTKAIFFGRNFLIFPFCSYSIVPFVKRHCGTSIAVLTIRSDSCNPFNTRTDTWRYQFQTTFLNFHQFLLPLHPQIILQATHLISCRSQLHPFSRTFRSTLTNIPFAILQNQTIRRKNNNKNIKNPVPWPHRACLFHTPLRSRI